MAARRRTRKPSHSRSSKRSAPAPKARTRARPLPVKPSRPAAPAAWYRDLDRARVTEAAQRYAGLRLQTGAWSPEEASQKASDYAIRLQSAARARELDYLNQAVKQLRRYAKGFESSDGFNLRVIASWPKSRVDKVRNFAETLRGRLTPYRAHVDVSIRQYRKPKKQRQFKRALALETGMDEREWTRYPVQVQHTKRRHRVVLTSDGGIEKRDYIGPGHFVRARQWNFKDFNDGKQPETRAEFVAAMQKIMAQLPKGERFKFISATHGAIGSMFSKETALDEMRLYWEEYLSDQTRHAGFSDILLGVTFFAMGRDVGMRKQVQEEKRRAKFYRDRDKRAAIAKRRQRYKAKQIARLRKLQLQEAERRQRDRKPRGKK